MPGLFGKTLSGELCETLLLISQAVKSNLPLADAIRLGLSDRLNASGKTDRALARLATLVEQGADPQKAIKEAGLPKQVAAIFEMSLKNSNFAEAFDELIRLETGQTATVNRIVATLAYPVLLLAITFSVFILFMIWVVPMFETVFYDFGISLPLITNCILSTSHIFCSKGIFFGFVTFFVILFVIPKLFFSNFWCSIPLFGTIGRSLVTCRILGQMAFFLYQHIPLPEALEQCANTIRNRAYRRDCLSAAKEAREGKSLPEIVVRYYRLFPAWLAPMLVLNPSGESVAKTFRRASETAEQEKETALTFLQVTSFPIFLVLFFWLISMLITAIFFPLVTLITSLSSF